MDHGYALTLHASQGLTVDRTHVLANDALFYEAGLVALSRHRDSCQVYVAGAVELSDDRERTHSPGRRRYPANGEAEVLPDLDHALRSSRADVAAIEHAVPQNLRSGPASGGR